MNTISIEDFQRHVPTTIKQVCRDHDPVLIGDADSGQAVLISLEDYQALEETAYLLQNPTNASRLFKAIESLELGQCMEFDSISFRYRI